MLACPRAGVPNNRRGHAGVSAAGHHHTTDTACGNRHLGDAAHEGEILRDRQAMHARMSACRCVQQAAKPDPCEGRLQTSHDRRCMCQPTSRQCRPSGRDPTRPATLRACMSACSCAQQAAGPDPCEGRMPTSHGRLAHGVLADTPCANRPMRHERGDPTRSASPAHKSNICTTPAARLPGGRAGSGRGEKGRVAWSSKTLHPINDPTLRPGHCKPFPQLRPPRRASHIQISGRTPVAHMAGVASYTELVVAGMVKFTTASG